MDWQDWVKRYLVEERKRKLRTIGQLLSGSVRQTAMRDGTPVNTTDEAIAENRNDVAELEKILMEAGVSFDD